MRAQHWPPSVSCHVCSTICLADSGTAALSQRTLLPCAADTLPLGSCSVRPGECPLVSRIARPRRTPSRSAPCGCSGCCGARSTPCHFRTCWSSSFCRAEETLIKAGFKKPSESPTIIFEECFVRNMAKLRQKA